MCFIKCPLANDKELFEAIDARQKSIDILRLHGNVRILTLPYGHIPRELSELCDSSLRLQNSTQRTVACDISMCLSTSMSLDCFCALTTQEYKKTRDHHNRESKVFPRRSFCSAVSRIHMHMCSPRLHMCPSSSPCPAHAVKRDLRSIFAPVYPCFLFFLFLGLFVTISLLLRSVSCCLSSRVLRLLTLATLLLLSAFIGLCLVLFVLISEYTDLLNE